MQQPTFLNPGFQSFDVITREITQLRETYNGLITITVPTTTTATFTRKQLENTSNIFIGVRIYSYNEVLSLLQDSDTENFNYVQNNHLDNITIIKNIAEKIYGPEKAWSKITIIENTLAQLDGIDHKQLDILQEINPIAYKAVQLYQDSYGLTLGECESSKSKKNFDDIIGKLILISVDKIPSIAQRIRSQYNSMLYKEFIINNVANTKVDESFLYENSFDEVNAVLEMGLESSKDFNLDEIAIVVPDNSQKQLFISLANSKKIPLSGSDLINLSDGQVISATSHILRSIESLINDDFISNFLEKYPWIETRKDRMSFNSYKNLIKDIRSSERSNEIFSAIYDYLENGYLNLIENLDEAEIELVNKQFTIIKQLSHLNSPITFLEAEMLLGKLAKSQKIRLNTLGNGLYIATPSDIIGSRFKTIYITSLRANYISENQQIKSLLSQSALEDLDIDINKGSDISETNNAIFNWLLNCSDKTVISTSLYNSENKKLEQNLEFESIFSRVDISDSTSLLSLNIDNENEHDAQIEYINSFFGDVPNTKNLLVSKNLRFNYSATSIEALAECPFKFFITKILRASETSVNENIDLIASMEKGNLVHKALEEHGLTGFDFESLSAYLNQSVIKLLENGTLPNDTAATINGYDVTELIQKFAELNDKKLASGSKVYKVEEKVSGTIITNNRSYEIKGKIDRIDSINDETFSIIDYKTGKKKTKGHFFDFGKRIQLGLYALLLEDKLNISTLEYWYFKENNNNEIEKKNFDEQVVEEVKEIFTKLVSVLESGVIAPRNYSLTSKPTKDGTPKIEIVDNCENCEVSDICFIEHQEMWSRQNLVEISKDYREVTGDVSKNLEVLK